MVNLFENQIGRGNTYKKIKSLIPNKFMSLANIKGKDHADHNKKNELWKRYRS